MLLLSTDNCIILKPSSPEVIGLGEELASTIPTGHEVEDARGHQISVQNRTTAVGNLAVAKRILMIDLILVRNPVQINPPSSSESMFGAPHSTAFSLVCRGTF